MELRRVVRHAAASDDLGVFGSNQAASPKRKRPSRVTSGRRAEGPKHLGTRVAIELRKPPAVVATPVTDGTLPHQRHEVRVAGCKAPVPLSLPSARSVHL